MDDESKQMLREILELQREQTELLRTYLLPPWLRMRFSVRGLLILMTIVAVILGIMVFANRPRIKKAPIPPPSPVFSSDDPFDSK